MPLVKQNTKENKHVFLSSIIRLKNMSHKLTKKKNDRKCEGFFEKKNIYFLCSVLLVQSFFQFIWAAFCVRTILLKLFFFLTINMILIFSYFTFVLRPKIVELNCMMARWWWRFIIEKKTPFERKLIFLSINDRKHAIFFDVFRRFLYTWFYFFLFMHQWKRQNQ